VKVEIHFTESWTRTRVLDLDEDLLAQHFDHSPPFTAEEVIEYLEENVSVPDGWTAGMVAPTLDVPGDEFEDITVWHATGPDLAPPVETMGGRVVQDVVDGL